MSEERVHLLSDYTWAGRRAACGVTSEFLPSVHSLEEVTCADCVAVAGEQPNPEACCPHWAGRHDPDDGSCDQCPCVNTDMIEVEQS